MPGYYASEENVCLKAEQLLSDLDSNPGSEYQFVDGCLPVFRDFFKVLRGESVRHPIVLQLYQSYQQVVDRFRGKLDLTKTERSFRSALVRYNISLDELTEGVISLKKAEKNPETFNQSMVGSVPVSEDLMQYLRNREIEKRQPSKPSGRKLNRVSYRDEAHDNLPDHYQTDDLRDAITERTDDYILEGFDRVRGLHQLLSEMYRESPVDENGNRELSLRFIESWTDYSRCVAFLERHRDLAKKIGKEIGEDLDRYIGKPKQLFEIRSSIASLPVLDVEQHFGDLNVKETGDIVS